MAAIAQRSRSSKAWAWSAGCLDTIKGGAVDIPICMSKASVSRDLITVLWRRLCLQPRRTEGFKFSTGPQLGGRGPRRPR